MLNGVQEGLNLQLNSWSPCRVFALRLNSQITRTVGDQLFLLPPWTPSRRLWAGAASGGDGLPNFSSRRRRSLRVPAPPAPAHRRAREARKLRQPAKKSLQKPGITPKSPTDCGTDPQNLARQLAVPCPRPFECFTARQGEKSTDAYGTSQSTTSGR